MKHPLKSSTYVDFDEVNNDQDLNVRLVTMWKCQNIKNIFGKIYAGNWPEEFFEIEKVISTVLWACY